MSASAGTSSTGTSSGASPLPTQTEGTVENAAAAGISLTAVLIGVIVLTVIVAWLVSRSRRTPPAPPHPGRPYANP